MDVRLLSIVSCTLWSTGSATPIPDTAKTQERQKPTNILFCIADDAGHMSAYGTPWIHTPAFDRVAREGILFENAYTCNAKSAPSRAAIITGRNSWQLKEACNHWADFPAEFKSYPEALAENGFYVGCTGKGWGPGIANDIYGRKREITGKMWNEKTLVPPTSCISKVDYAANFEEFMKARPKGKPFCFWYGALEPHRDYEYGSSLKTGKRPELIDSVPDYWPDNEAVRTDMLDYALEVEHFDTHLGRILNILEESGELENTIVIVTSDHGMPFPRCKGQDYNNSNHIPMSVMWKNGLVKPGRRVDDYISVIDIAPTLLEVAGISQEKAGMRPITGRSFMDILKNEQPDIDRGFVMIGKERHDVGRPDDQGYPIRGMIRGNYLYLKNFETGRWPAGNPETGYMNVDGGPTKTEILKARRNPKTAHYWQLAFGKRDTEELYDIKKDPDCMVDLAGKPEYELLKRRMEKEMTARLVEQEDPRMFGRGRQFDYYPDMSGAYQFWNRTKAGEKVPSGWISETDFEPVASGLRSGWSSENEAEFRIQDFEQRQHPDVMAKVNKTNGYSLLDNATGIVARKDRVLFIKVGETGGDTLRIKIQNLDCPNGDGYENGSSYYLLHEGMNRIIPENDGLVYVLFHTRGETTGKKVRIHFLTGEVNGYFDIKKHKASQWRTLLDKATYKYFDVLGEYAHLTFPVESFRQYTPDGKALVEVFDRIVALEHEFMGLNKYTDKQFKNRQYCHVVNKGYMYAPNYRTAYGVSTMEKVCDIDKLIGIALWGPAHEIGHINQIRPGAKWHGMTEVTNNIYCLYVQDAFGMTTRLQKEVERPTKTYDDCWYERAMTEYFTRKLAHNENRINHCRLVPFWQLYLYCVKVKGNDDFYKDLYESVRMTPNPVTAGKCQLEFVKKACAAAKMDLTPFFEKFGFLKPFRQEVNDYGKRVFEVTAEDIEQTRKEIKAKKYPKLQLPFWYITDNTVDLFKSPQPVKTGTAICKGNTFTMKDWKGVAAYEVFQKGKLVFVAPLQQFTVEGVIVDEKTKVYAIAADGKKTEVDFQWTEDLEQQRKMKERVSKYGNMYNR